MLAFSGTAFFIQQSINWR